MAAYAALGLTTFILGYFSGREHLKYQISTAFSQFGEALQEGLASSQKSNEKVFAFEVMKSELVSMTRDDPYVLMSGSIATIMLQSE